MTLCQTQPSADPNWWQGAAIYQIYTRTFTAGGNSNNVLPASVAYQCVFDS